MIDCHQLSFLCFLFFLECTVVEIMQINSKLSRHFSLLGQFPFSIELEYLLNCCTILCSLQEQREREKQDLELAKEMAEDDDDFP